MDAKPVTDYLQASSGIKSEKALNFETKFKYKWTKPPINGWLGYIFPSDQTYHPLINSTNYEILTTVFAVESSDLPESEKAEIKEQIQKIVEEGPEIKTWGAIYVTSFIFSIFLIILVILLLIYGVKMLFSTVSIILFILSCGLIYLFAFSLPFAKGRGLEAWQNFTSAYAARTASGNTAGKILEEMRAEAEREETLKQLSAVQNTRNNNTQVFTGSLLGSMLGNSFKK